MLQTAAVILTTDAAMARFLQVVQRSKSRNTWASYSKTLKSVRAFLPDHFQDITWEHLLDWQSAASEHKLKCGKRVNLNSVDTALTAIKAWCRWVVEMYDLNVNPAKKIKYLVAVSQRSYNHRILTHEEFAQIVRAAGKLRLFDKTYNQQAQDAILWLAHTGIRCMEFKGLTWGCFAKDRMSFRILGKGRKTRIVPCDNVVCQEIIARYKDQPDISFVRRFTVHPTALTNLCTTLTRRCNIEQFSPHSLRHYYVTRMAELGVPIKVISMIIGHANTQITEMVYTHLNTQSIMGWSKKLNQDGS